MFLRLFLMMTIIPIAEIALLLHIHGELSGMFGSGNALLITVGSVIFTGIVGANLARSQGFQTLSKIQLSMSKGHMPASEMIDGVMILIGGVLLLTPGYATDIFGFLLLFPVSRQLFKHKLSSWMTNQVRNGSIHVSYYGQNTQPHTNSRPSYEDPNIVDIKPIEDRSDK